MTSPRKPLLFIALAVACSREKQAAPAAKAGPKDSAAASAAVKANVPGAPPKPVAPVPKIIAGAYVRGESSLFRPCAEKKYYVMRERGDARNVLRERFWYTAKYMGLPMYAVFYGFFFDDSIKAPASDKPASAGSTVAKPMVVKRFMLTRVDSLRAYISSTDCKRAAK